MTFGFIQDKTPDPNSWSQPQAKLPGSAPTRTPRPPRRKAVQSSGSITRVQLPGPHSERAPAGRGPCLSPPQSPCKAPNFRKRAQRCHLKSQDPRLPLELEPAAPSTAAPGSGEAATAL